MYSIQIYVIVYSIQIYVLAYSIQIYVLAYSIQIYVLAYSIQIYVLAYSIQIYVIAYSIQIYVLAYSIQIYVLAYSIQIYVLAYSIQIYVIAYSILAICLNVKFAKISTHNSSRLKVAPKTLVQLASEVSAFMPPLHTHQYCIQKMWLGGQTEFPKYRGGEGVYDVLTLQKSGGERAHLGGKAPHP